ncbi:hypothetical protein [Novosphingobium percolationis]|uniref:hypothetical protein n=1 Tax=Novosphingobium percolationis TaxID=2871811 RepID=UPI001CD7464E|nr:hypothetical protein [Novosphingobium percolationis]
MISSQNARAVEVIALDIAILRCVSRGSPSMNYTPQEYEQLAAKAGQDAHQRLSALVGNAAFGGMTPEAQRKAIQKAIEVARKGARGESAAKGLPMLPPTVASKHTPPPPPPGFKMD